MQKKTILILGCLTVFLLAIAVIFSSSNPSSHQFEQTNTVFFPHFEKELENVTKVELKKNSDSFSVVKQDKGWVIPSKDNYPVDIEVVRAHLIALATMKKLEPKTSKAERYTRLAVQDINMKQTEEDKKQGYIQPTLVTVDTKEKQAFTQVIIGDYRYVDAYKTNHYVRLVDNKQSWLVQTTQKIQTSWRDWVNRKIDPILADDVQSFEVIEGKKSKLKITKEKKEDKDFKVSGKKKNQKIKSQFEINSIAQIASDLEFDDVVSEQTFKTKEKVKQVSQSIFKSFSGFSVEYSLFKQEGKKNYWLKVVAKATKSDQDVDQQVLKKVNELNQKYGSWVFLISEWAGKRLSKEKKDILE